MHALGLVAASTIPRDPTGCYKLNTHFYKLDNVCTLSRGAQVDTNMRSQPHADISLYFPPLVKVYIQYHLNSKAINRGNNLIARSAVYLLWGSNSAFHGVVCL